MATAYQTLGSAPPRHMDNAINGEHGITFYGPTPAGYGADRTVLTGRSIEHLAEQLRLALDIVENVSGYTAPDTIPASDLDEVHVGTHQVRGIQLEHDDGATTWGEWHDIHGIAASPFGDGFEIDCGDGHVLETGTRDECVQIRRRLPVDQLRTVA